MNKNRKKIALSRETLRSLDAPELKHAAGGATLSVAVGCHSGCDCTVTCATDCAGYTCLPCQG